MHHQLFSLMRQTQQAIKGLKLKLDLIRVLEVKKRFKELCLNCLINLTDLIIEPTLKLLWQLIKLKHQVYNFYIDPALIRPGRIDRKIEFPNPDEKTKKKIFQIHTGKMNLCPEVSIGEFVNAKDELTGADIKALCTEVYF